jgi:alpha-tubulin suppressor-like RCC1 family protein
MKHRNLERTMKMNSIRPIVLALALGSALSVTITSPAQGDAYRAWGDNVKGQLGDGTIIDRHAPIDIPALDGEVVQFAAGLDCAFALMADGTVKAWGSNQYGQLGNGTTVDSLTPITVPGLSNVQKIAVNTLTAFAIKTDGSVWAWGINYEGELGLGNWSQPVKTPTQVPALTGITKIVPGSWHSLAVRADGTVLAWGTNMHGQLGQNPGIGYDYVPKPVPNLTNVVQAAVGIQFSVAMKGDGTVVAWGFNWYGQLGNGTIDDTHIPTPVSNLTGVVQIAAGGFHAAARLANGDVYSWGRNEYGQLGHGQISQNQYSSTKVKSLVSKVTDIQAQYNSTFALTESDVLFAWGQNTNGQLGDDTTGSRNTPAPVGKLTTPISFTVGYEFVIAIMEWPGAAINPCPADMAPSNGDGMVNVADLLKVINSWGACP